MTLPYCDNVTIFSTSPEEARQKRDALVEKFEGLGIHMHEISEVTEPSEILGAYVSSHPATARGSTRKMWCRKKLLEWVAHGAPITSETLEKIVGHVVFASLFLPSAFIRGAGHVQLHPRQPRRKGVSLAWPSVRYEMWIAASLLPLASANLSANRFPRVACTDAAPNGIGGCFKTLAPERCEEVGKWEEMALPASEPG